MSERCAYCGSEEPDNGPRKFVCTNDRDEFGFICWDCAQKSVRREQMEADCRAVCAFCRRGDVVSVGAKPPYTGMWIHEYPNPNHMPNLCGGNAIRKAANDS